MTPDQIAKVSEHSHQKALFAWANCAAMYGFEIAFKDEWYSLKTRPMNGFGENIEPVPAMAFLFAIHNQGHGDAIRGNRAKGEGVKAGVPDCMFPVPKGGYAGLFIEMKKAKDGTVKDDQERWHEFLRANFYQVSVAWSWREAADILMSYYRA